MSVMGLGLTEDECRSEIVRLEKHLDEAISNPESPVWVGKLPFILARETFLPSREVNPRISLRYTDAFVRLVMKLETHDLVYHKTMKLLYPHCVSRIKELGDGYSEEFDPATVEFFLQRIFTHMDSNEENVSFLARIGVIRVVDNWKGVESTKLSKFDMITITVENLEDLSRDLEFSRGATFDDKSIEDFLSQESQRTNWLVNYVHPLTNAISFRSTIDSEEIRIISTPRADLTEEQVREWVLEILSERAPTFVRLSELGTIYSKQKGGTLRNTLGAHGLTMKKLAGIMREDGLVVWADRDNAGGMLRRLKDGEDPAILKKLAEDIGFTETWIKRWRIPKSPDRLSMELEQLSLALGENTTDKWPGFRVLRLDEPGKWTTIQSTCMRIMIDSERYERERWRRAQKRKGAGHKYFRGIGIDKCSILLRLSRFVVSRAEAEGECDSVFVKEHMNSLMNSLDCVSEKPLLLSKGPDWEEELLRKEEESRSRKELAEKQKEGAERRKEREAIDERFDIFGPISSTGEHELIGDYLSALGGRPEQRSDFDSNLNQAYRSRTMMSRLRYKNTRNRMSVSDDLVWDCYCLDRGKSAEQILIDILIRTGMTEAEASIEVNDSTDG